MLHEAHSGLLIPPFLSVFTADGESCPLSTPIISVNSRSHRELRTAELLNKNPPSFSFGVGESAELSEVVGGKGGRRKQHRAIVFPSELLTFQEVLPGAGCQRECSDALTWAGSAQMSSFSLARLEVHE